MISLKLDDIAKLQSALLQTLANCHQKKEEKLIFEAGEGFFMILESQKKEVVKKKSPVKKAKKCK